MPAGRRDVKACVIASCLLLGAGCATPEYTYVAGEEHRTVFKVPADWDQLDPELLPQVLFGVTAEELKAGGGSLVGYDAAPTPSVSHLATASLEDPVVYLAVVERGEAAAMSDDQLRDLIHPVTPAARSGEAAQLVPGTFTLLSDERIRRPEGIHGVHVVYSYGASGKVMVFDQTTLTNAESSWVYAMLVQCSPECRKRNLAAIRTVVDSFTVRR